MCTKSCSASPPHKHTQCSFAWILSTQSLPRPHSTTNPHTDPKLESSRALSTFRGASFHRAALENFSSNGTFSKSNCGWYLKLLVYPIQQGAFQRVLRGGAQFESIMKAKHTFAKTEPPPPKKKKYAETLGMVFISELRSSGNTG